MFFRLFLIVKGLLAKPIVTVSLLSLAFVAYSTQVMAEKVSSKPVILVYGDSLSAGYGLAQQQGWVTLLQKKLDSEHYQYQVVNASVSGETTSGGLARIDAALTINKPSLVILELGANDGLRGLPIKNMADNLTAMIQKSKKTGAKVLLLGMRIPPNYGPKYAQAFSQTYQDISKENQMSLVPFMLENVAAKPQLIQDDGLHPNALGQPILLDNIWPHLSSLLIQPASKK